MRSEYEGPGGVTLDVLELDGGPADRTPPELGPPPIAYDGWNLSLGREKPSFAGDNQKRSFMGPEEG
jgi:hypothetical protein